MGDVIEAVKHKVTVFSQSWESASDDSFVSKISDFKSRWYFRVPSGSAIEGVEVYNSDYGMSFVTSEELTFTQAEAKAKELGALACLPVLE